MLKCAVHRCHEWQSCGDAGDREHGKANCMSASPAARLAGLRAQPHADVSMCLTWQVHVCTAAVRGKQSSTGFCYVWLKIGRAHMHYAQMSHELRFLEVKQQRGGMAGLT